ncbi:hypothetical protein F8M41_015288 [Gigaspora margarita]|uniref:Uncharacterized protein n=1 Tax=Gigaspora margarita TaxID=4874 RepID=A0A8H3WUW2_GIGMA|nr:hypothetical protein F8M41_015288 [Gigaspora margarita]
MELEYNYQVNQIKIKIKSKTIKIEEIEIEIEKLEENNLFLSQKNKEFIGTTYTKIDVGGIINSIMEFSEKKQEKETIVSEPSNTLDDNILEEIVMQL